MMPLTTNPLAPMRVSGVQSAQRLISGIERMRHPNFPLANEPGVRVNVPGPPQAIRRSRVPSWTQAAASAGRVQRIDPAQFSSVFTSSRSIRAAADALLGT